MNAIDWTSVIETLIGTFGGAILAFGSSIMVDYFVRKRNREERIKMFLMTIQENSISIKKIHEKLVLGMNQNKIKVAISEICDERNIEYRVFSVRKTYNSMMYDIFKSSQKKPRIRRTIKQIVEWQDLLFQKISDIDMTEKLELESRELNDKVKGVVELIKMHNEKIESIDWFINEYNAKIDADR